MGDISTKIHYAIFGDLELPSPISLQVNRQGRESPAASDTDAYNTSICITRPDVRMTLRLGKAILSESLRLGLRGRLAITLSPADFNSPVRLIGLEDAVLVSIESAYIHSGASETLLVFSSQAADDGIDPFFMEDLS